MALTTEQQTSHLSRLQQEVLTWDYYRMGGEDDAGASSGRILREVPYTFAGITEYLDVFEPLVLEECAAQLVRGDEEDVHPSTIGAVFRSERREGFHVVQFILGEEAMSEFHDNDLILVSKTDPAADQNVHDDDEGDDKGDDKDEAKDDAEEDAADAEDGLRRVYALGYVDGRDSRNMMRVRFTSLNPRLRSRATPRTRARSARKITRGFARCATRLRRRVGRGISCTSRTCPRSRGMVGASRVSGVALRARHPQREAVQRPRALVLGTPGGAAEIHARRVQR